MLAEDRRMHTGSFNKAGLKTPSDWDRRTVFMNTDSGVASGKADRLEESRRNREEDSKMRFNFDTIFANPKLQRGSSSVSPQTSHLKSVSSPFCSPPDRHLQSTNGFKQNLRDSRIDLMFDLETYDGPRVSIGKGQLINEYCVDHPDKKCKFYITNNMFTKDLGSVRLNRAFCSKCSVQIAMKGFTVEEVLRDDEFNRKRRIDSFLLMLNSIRHIETRRLQSVRSEANETPSFYAHQLQKTDAFFGRLIDLIKMKHRLVLDRLIQAREAAEEQSSSLTNLINLKLETVQAMRLDIESNLDKIITKIDSEPFNQIISNYEQNIAVLEGQIEQHATQVQEKVVTKGTSECDKTFQNMLGLIISVEKCPHNVLQGIEPLLDYGKTDELGASGRS